MSGVFDRPVLETVREGDPVVISASVRAIVRVTRAEYDLLDPPDPETLYVVID